MRGFLLFATCLLLSAAALAVDKKPSCSFTVSPLRGESSITGNRGSGLLNRSSSSQQLGTGSKTIERNLKWKVELRFREERPESLQLKAFYLGYSSDNKLVEIGKEQKSVELDKNGRASVELTSPTTRLTKTRSYTTSSSRYSGGFTSSKTTRSGQRVTGCVLQLFGDGEMLKSYASDSRWTVAAAKDPFSLSELTARSGKIGLR